LCCFQGQHSAQDEQGTAALKTVELDNELGGAAVQVRVVQGKEPAHFLTIFSGKMIILRGGKASSFDGNFIISHQHNHISINITIMAMNSELITIRWELGQARVRSFNVTMNHRVP
jgi:hypothetical protein